MDPVISDAEYQDKVLPHVSRTFALTIPQLPAALRIPVTNAYLLCRIADTIEDEPALSPTETLAFMQRFMGALAGRGDPQALGFELAKRLSDRTLPTERDLVSNLQRVINVTAGLNTPQRAAIHLVHPFAVGALAKTQLGHVAEDLGRGHRLARQGTERGDRILERLVH